MQSPDSARRSKKTGKLGVAKDSLFSFPLTSHPRAFNKKNAPSQANYFLPH